MKETRCTESFLGGYVSYPKFSSEEGDTPDARRMNAFYETLRDAVIAHGETLQKSGTAFQYTADYMAQQNSANTWHIEYLLRLRRRGRTVSTRRLSHDWADGLLVMPKRTRKKSVFLLPDSSKCAIINRIEKF